MESHPSNKANISSQKNYGSMENLEELNTSTTSVDSDPTKVLCLVCHKEIQRVNLKKHFLTSRHKKNSEIIANNKKIEFPIKPEDLSIKRAEAMLALFAIEHHNSIFEIDHLSEICGKAFRGSKASPIKLDRTKCIKIINKDLAPHFRELNVNEINNAQKYSVIMDEITDASSNKFLVIIVRYFSSSKASVVSAFLALELLESSDAQGIVNVLINCLNCHKIPIQNMVGIGTDIASSMPLGRKTVYAILKTEHNLPNLVLIRCMCHSLQLAVSRSSENSLPINLEFLVRETYKWFADSSKRQEKYSQIYESIFCGETDLKVLKICDIRWLSIEPVVFRILGKWEELKVHFGLAKKFCYTADQLYSMYSDESNRLYLYFLKSILRTLQTAIKTFRSDEHCDPFELLNSLILLLRSLCSGIIKPTAIRTDRDYLTFEIEKHLSEKPQLGSDFESKISESNLSKDKIRRNCTNFAVQLVKEVQKMIPSNFIALQKMQLLSVQNALKPYKDRSIVDLAKCLGFQDEKVEKILKQWNDINCVRWEQLSDSVRFWGEVSRHKNAEGLYAYKELFDLARTVMSLPYSNGEVEDIFSMVTMLKHKLGNDLTPTLLNSIMLIRNQLKIQQRHCHDYEIPESVLKNFFIKNTTVAEVEEIIIDDDVIFID